MKTRLIAVAVGLACAASIPVAQATNGYMSHAYSPSLQGHGRVPARRPCPRTRCPSSATRRA